MLFVYRAGVSPVNMGVYVFWKVNVSPCHDSLVDGVLVVLHKCTSPESFQKCSKLWIILQSMFVVKNDEFSQDTFKELV